MSENQSRNVGFIGLGLMGSQFTHRLVKQGFTVHGYDKAAEKKHSC